MASSTTLAERGFKAFTVSNYPEAISLYSQALAINPEAPDYYIKRSTAYQRSAQYELALYDAELAVMLAHCRGKRELIGTAQLRRAIALHLLGRYGDAAFCLSEAETRCTAVAEKNMIGVWRKKLEMVLEKLDDDDVAREVTITAIPEVDVPKAQAKIVGLDTEKGKGKVPAAGGGTASSNAWTASTSPTTASSTPAAVAAPPPPPPSLGSSTPSDKIRHEWYQTPTHVVLTVYAKGVPKDKATIEIHDKTVSISFPLSSGSDFTFDVDPLWDFIQADQSHFNIYSTKIEVNLRKENPNKKWADLEGEAEAPVETAAEASKEDKPVYPSSSKAGPKDWDKLARDLSAKSKDKKGKGKGKDGEEDAEDEADMVYDSDDGGDPVNMFFKKLYKDADEDTRRAMMKSYIESNGTALSTNWSEVGKAQVETSPPDGMEAKKWGE